jgi:palmitoyltransferase
MFSASFTICLQLYAQFVITRVLILPWLGLCIHIPLYTCFALLSVISHCRAQFSNPGVVPMSLTTSLDKMLPKVPRMCKRCKIVKPHTAHHCSTCERCVIRMDHHCPWVNNCVAIYNQKHFLLFLFYTAVTCIYSGVLLIARFISCTQNSRQCSIGGVEAGLCIANFIEALIFGLFVIIMFCDQISAIFENTGVTEGSTGAYYGRYDALKEVFGEPFSYRWFLPLAPTAAQYQLFEKETRTLQWVIPPTPQIPVARALPPAASAADNLNRLKAD